MPPAKTHVANGVQPGEQFLMFWCPGCDEAHGLRIAGRGRPKWSWDRNPDRPTCMPSLITHQATPAKRCHLFVRGGNLEFLPDCWHALKGQTVPIPDWPD